MVLTGVLRNFKVYVPLGDEQDHKAATVMPNPG